jgi:hypothetical protein
MQLSLSYRDQFLDKNKIKNKNWSNKVLLRCKFKSWTSANLNHEHKLSSFENLQGCYELSSFWEKNNMAKIYTTELEQ